MELDNRSQFRALRARFSGRDVADRTILPLGIDEIDRKLPGGGLVRGALHEVAGGANGAVDGAAAAAFAAGLAARTGGTVLWCHIQPDLFTPALAQCGLTSDRVVFFETREEKAILGCFEEALRHGGLGAVVAEIGHLSLKASQRLQFAAATSGTMGIAVRRWRRQTEARDFGSPTAAATRWRVTETELEKLPVRGVGRARWLLELMRARGGDCADFEVEAFDAQGHLGLPAHMADRSAASVAGWSRAAS
ncbi:damage-inducible protein [Asticcacaulis sp. ZE23SCel15]|uniref:ImuA family protein n=1 Tax=Asticcacaulis sp. ZE23SCel15 TaxID=3059027 RepID=UPI00265F2F98|nr:damage-inducible protein [Asticcacaulis sp. ZE23SCel15]WKL56543.1 damage-inducible protein [Asticcacaulis sp. ZE23SCel15]